MEGFLLLFVLNFVAGLLPDLGGPDGGNGGWSNWLPSLLPAVLLGMASVVASNALFMTQVAVLISYTGLMAGTLISPFSKTAKVPLVLGRSFGVLAAFVPKTAALILALAVAGSWISNNAIVALAWACLLLPFVTAAIYKHDVYILLAGLMSVTSISILIPTLETATKRRPDSLVKRRLLFFKVTAFCLILFFLTGLFLTKYVYRGFGMQVDIFRHGNPEFKLVALTFDDGPNPIYTPRILDILEEHQVLATFFMVGKNVESHPHIARRIVEAGHDIGNHTYSHRSLIPLSAAATGFQIMEAHRIIEEVTGEKPVLFRPPRGVYSDISRELLKKEGYTMVLWNVTSRDWTETNVRSIANNVINHTEPGSIILLHDCGNLITGNGGNRGNTVKALPLIIKGLQERGYTFVSIKDMIIATGLTHVFEEEE